MGSESYPGPALRNQGQWLACFLIPSPWGTQLCPCPRRGCILTLLVTAAPFAFLAISALGLLPCSVLLGTAAQGQRAEVLERIPAAASKPKFREPSQACPGKKTRAGGMSFPKTVFRFPSGETSERVEDRTMNYFRSALNPRGRGSYWEEEEEKKFLPGKQRKKKKFFYPQISFLGMFLAVEIKYIIICDNNTLHRVL